VAPGDATGTGRFAGAVRDHRTVEYEYDAFMSHAAEDKAVAEPIVHGLSARGHRIWFDSAELLVGDVLGAGIDHGLARSRFGIFVLSPMFFAKPWPTTELNAVVSLAVESGDIRRLLPVLHNMENADLLRCSPILASRVSARTSDGLATVTEVLDAALRRTPRSLATPTPAIRPTSVRVERDGGLFHTRIRAAFRLGFDHELVYERHDSLSGGRLTLRLDGKLVVDERLWKASLGRSKWTFTVENCVGTMSTRGAVLGMWVSVKVADVEVFTG
jgi:hypothetical protein